MMVTAGKKGKRRIAASKQEGHIEFSALSPHAQVHCTDALLHCSSAMHMLQELVQGRLWVKAPLAHLGSSEKEKIMCRCIE